MTSPSTETLRASPSSYLQPDWNPNWTQGNIQPAPSYVPLSLIYDPLTQRNHDENSLTEGSLYSPSSSLTFTGESSPPATIKKGWGTTKGRTSRRHSHAGGSISGRHSSRVKEKEHQSPPSKRSSVSGSSKGHQLRSTRTGHTISYSEQEDDPRTETTNSRTSHNMVEKQYRNRLNGQFSTLLEALPLDLVGAEVEGYSKNDSGGTEKKVSKAEVLLLARRHIENLEREKRGLEGRNRVLVEDIQNLKGAWVGRGGQVLP
jgi:Helix-loop-helix DNA-binding domain